jgi:hypothetical protein
LILFCEARIRVGVWDWLMYSLFSLSSLICFPWDFLWWFACGFLAWTWSLLGVGVGFWSLLLPRVHQGKSSWLDALYSMLWCLVFSLDYKSMDLMWFRWFVSFDFRIGDSQRLSMHVVRVCPNFFPIKMWFLCSYACITCIGAFRVEFGFLSRWFLIGFRIQVLMVGFNDLLFK